MKKIHKKKTTFAFIDASNIIYGASDHGWRMDFEKLILYLRTRYNALNVYYYAGLDTENKKQLRFYEKLQELGYILRLIPVKKFKDGKKKADVDSRMTFEMMMYFPMYKRAIVMSGDGDFYWVLEYLLEKKQEVKLVAHSKSTARELKQLFAHRFINIEDLKDLLKLSISKKDLKK